MQLEAIENRAIEAQIDKYKLNELIKDYKPFIISCIKDTKGSYVDTYNDEELSIGLISFENAIKTFDYKKGNFLSYAKILIRRRIIDHLRKIHRDRNIIYLDDFNEQLRYDAFCENNNINERAEEIKRLEEELKNYNIKFDELIDVSPKHKKTRELCKSIIRTVIKNRELVYILKKTKKLPTYEIETLLDIKRRKFERARKYIIAGIIVLDGDYDYINEYI